MPLTPVSRHITSVQESEPGCVALALNGLEVIDEHTEHLMDDGLAGRATPGDLPALPASLRRLGILEGGENIPAIAPQRRREARQQTPFFAVLRRPASHTRDPPHSGLTCSPP